MNRPLDVLFVNADSSAQAYQELSKDFSAIEPPTWALLLAQACRANGFGVAILDCGAERLSDEQAVQRIGEMPDPPRLLRRLWPESEFRHDQHDRRDGAGAEIESRASRGQNLFCRLAHQRAADGSAVAAGSGFRPAERRGLCAAKSAADGPAVRPRPGQGHRPQIKWRPC